METQNQIKAEITRCKEKIDDLRNIHKNLPGYAEIMEKASKLRDDYIKLVQPQINDYYRLINEYTKNINELKKKKDEKYPENVRKWFDSYGNGVNFGYGGLKISWISENNQYVILTSKGGTAGQGTAMGTGGYYYAPSTHWLAKVDAGGYFARPNNMYGQIEGGRLTNEVKNKLIARIPEFEEYRKNGKI